MNRSIPILESFEIINFEPVNSMISRCEIKVLYLGPNRNNTVFSKSVAIEMAKTLPGTPIVGLFNDNTKDFEEHTMENPKIEKGAFLMKPATSPYGFIPFDAQVWFQDFLDSDGEVRKYLVTEGYLWTGRYPESRIVLSRGCNHSMELDPASVRGQWSIIPDTDKELFFVEQASFSALCILGETVEPCFQGSNITRDSNTLFSLENKGFESEMQEFMSDLKVAMQNYQLEGGISMLDKTDKDLNVSVKDQEKEFIINNEKETGTKETEVDLTVPEVAVNDKEIQTAEVNSENGNSSDEGASDEPSSTDFAKQNKKKEEVEKEDSKDNKEVKEEDSKADKDKDSKKEDSESEDAKKVEEEEDKKKKSKTKFAEEDSVSFSEHAAVATELLNTQYQLSALKKTNFDLNAEVEELRAFKEDTERQSKFTMIDKFYMLSDEDKKDIRDNCDKYSLEEIEAQLSVQCVRSTVNFNDNHVDTKQDNRSADVLSYNVNSETQSQAPAWIKAVDRVVKQK